MMRRFAHVAWLWPSLGQLNKWKGLPGIGKTVRLRAVSLMLVPLIMNSVWTHCPVVVILLTEIDGPATGFWISGKLESWCRNRDNDLRRFVRIVVRSGWGTPPHLVGIEFWFLFSESILDLGEGTSFFLLPLFFFFFVQENFAKSRNNLMRVCF